ncbi:transmembrane protein 150C [Brachionichthys hirsutus]|uniref:transmembrane protein 150C n=1 Tax=Brachionichthys hirsutus TaxID=412623 RepID=UPI0036051CB0
MLNWSPWAFLPLFFSTFAAVGLWVVYFIAVSNGTIAPLGSPYRGNGSIYAPYISIAGQYPPASCVFGEVMNLSAFLGIIIVAFRYLQLKPRIQAWLNIVTLAGFSLACFGMTLVGNFQLFDQTIVHNCGSFMTFVFGAAFCWVQSYITLRVDVSNEGKAAAVLRFLLSALITLCLVSYMVFLSRRAHVQAAQWQWALVMSFLAFFGTFAIEFRRSNFEAVCVELRRQPLSMSEPAAEASMQQHDK